jgi:glyoxylase-like metal-dependent hydrolase (beta-lactamase superfamily II)
VDDCAVLIDSGSGDVLDVLSKIGVTRVTDVLITHHHRDQCQGLDRAKEAGISIWVPHIELDLSQAGEPIGNSGKP